MSTRLLFLDIDGVMHSVDRVQGNQTSTGIDYTDDRLFEHLPLLGRILDQCPDVSVNISSSWRDIHTLPQLQRFFGDWGHRVIGTTASMDTMGAMRSNRFQQCQAMAQQLGASEWVMVDDQPGIVWGSQIPPRELVRKVIWCDPVLGLATPLVAHAILKRFIGDAAH